MYAGNGGGQMGTQILDAALQFARFGWKVFPLAPGSKVPLARSRGVHDATTDPRQRPLLVAALACVSRVPCGNWRAAGRARGFCWPSGSYRPGGRGGTCPFGKPARPGSAAPGRRVLGPSRCRRSRHGRRVRQHREHPVGGRGDGQGGAHVVLVHGVHAPCHLISGLPQAEGDVRTMQTTQRGGTHRSCPLRARSSSSSRHLMTGPSGRA